MPATAKHIQTNFDRIAAGDSDDLKKLVELVKAGAADDATPNQIWNAFVAKADEAKIADQIPGTVGRQFAQVYGTKAAKGPRGQLFELPLTPAALNAFGYYMPLVDVGAWPFKITGPSDGLPSLQTRNRVKSAKSIAKLIDYSAQKDVETPAKQAAAMRTALKAVVRKVEPQDA
jgi:hypothetical protein